MVLHLHRFCQSISGTFGVLWVAGCRFYTVERPWQDNEPFVSCIPEGVFPVRWDRYNRGGYRTLAVTVPGRTRILIHRGNLPRHVQGCIAIGQDLGVVWDRETKEHKWGVLRSTTAFDRWLALLDQQGSTPRYLWVTSGRERELGDG